jgi:3-deoxy-D-manno-octulosonic-acid transferase
MIIFLYNLALIVLRIFLPVYYLINPRLRKRQSDYKKSISGPIKLKSNARIWFHAASMGEFEQAKPVIEYLKRNNPEIEIIATFFSPSGFENQKNYQFADFISYIPIDFKGEVRKFLNLIKPDIVVFIRYEIWLNLLLELNKRKIPRYLICATAPLKDSNLIRKFYKAEFSLFDEIFAIEKFHADYFNALLGNSNTNILPDTRFDRIAERVEANRDSEIISDSLLKKYDKVLVAGSTWQPDEAIIIEGLKTERTKNRNKILTILVPHEPTKQHLGELLPKIDRYILLSQLEAMELIEIEKLDFLDYIVVDSIGKLLKLYSVADLAYVGGAFGVGIHSSAEPAGYGLPISSGPKIELSPDAKNLNSLGALTIIRTPDDFSSWMDAMLSDSDTYNKSSLQSRDYVFNFLGSSRILSDKIISIISNKIS